MYSIFYDAPMNDLAERRFGRLKVIRFDKRTAYGAMKWLCICDCGKRTSVFYGCLVGGKTKSCGCLASERAIYRGLKHGKSKGRIYTSWNAMKMRCLNSRNLIFKNYGGRGIKVCKRWMKFENFYKDMGERPEGMNLGRINNNGDYKPSNCRWETQKQQNGNKTNSRLIVIGGRKMLPVEWAKVSGINYNTLNTRLLRGWSFFDAVFRKTGSYEKKKSKT